MPKLKFKAGNRVAPIIPAKMTVDTSPCRELYLRAHQDNTDDIVIGDSEHLDGAVAAVAAIASIGLDTGDITVTAEQGGTPFNDVVISFETVAGTPVATPTAVATADTIVITVNDTVNTTTANINTAVNGLTYWSAAVANAGVFDPGDVGVTDTTAGGDGVTNATATLTLADAGEITVTAAAVGAEWNDKVITFAVSDGVTAALPVATIATNAIIITVNATTTTTTANIVTAIALLTDWGATEATGGSFDPKDAGVTDTSAGGVGQGAARGFILGAGEDVTIDADSPDDIYCYCAADLQVLSWIINGA
jgi:hypothetical protein